MDERNEKRSTKVDRVIESYGLTGLGADLERMWVSVEGDNWSLRDLADYFNQQVLRVAAEQEDLELPEWQLEPTYQILTGDEVSPSERMQRTRDLERHGIDVDELLKNFVSHQTVHTYLTEHRGVSRPNDRESDRAFSAKRAINRIQSRTSAVVESNIDRLRSTDELVIGDSDVLVTVEVYCNDCGVSKSFSDLVEDGGCDCRNA